jgi:hypothetical protein
LLYNKCSCFLLLDDNNGDGGGDAGGSSKACVYLSIASFKSPDRAAVFPANLSSVDFSRVVSMVMIPGRE